MSSVSSKIHPSKDHNNWITVGEVIHLIKKPVALYTSQIVKDWHVRLRKDCLPFGPCPNHGRCQTKRKAGDLCPSCSGWYKKLAKSHRNNEERQIKWRENCDTSLWPVDPWEVAKFFMPALGGNKGTTKDAESSDLSSLLNVLKWMNDKAFGPNRRVDLDLVNKLRLEVRNPWAHAPNQELTDADLINAFDIANKFVADLDKVFCSCAEVKQCAKDILFVKANGISNVVEAEFKTLILLRHELVADVSQMKGEINHLKENRSSDRQIIKGNEKKLENLENRIGQLQNIVKVQKTERHAELKSCVPEKPPMFIGRDAEVKEIISSLVEEGCGIVSIVGGPGFGKSTVAAEVSHRLGNNHDIIVIFSYLSNVSTVPEVILRLCRDVGVNPGDDPESSLMLWLGSLQRKVVIVMDNIEQLLEDDLRSKFTELVVTLRKNSQQQLQILTTTRTTFSIPNQIIKDVQIRQLDENASVELLREFCLNKEVKDENLSDLALLCGFIPLALCITGSRIPRVDDPAELIQWVREKPMKALQSTDKRQCVRKAIEFSFQMLSNEDKKSFARLSVFNGNFQKKSAQEVIERDGLETQYFLEELVARSLIQSSSDNRFVIHSLIRRYLADHDYFQDEKAIAQGLVVKHFLNMCHSLTMKFYSKDGFTLARELLKKDGHNVEETFKICSQAQARNLSPNIIECLESSEIYKFSSRFFYDFGWDLLPLTVLRNFNESCIKLAEGREQIAIQITFQCLVADQEGRKTGWKSSEYIERMMAIKETFYENDAMLKEDWSLYSYCYYFFAQYYSKIETNDPYPDLQADAITPLAEIRDRSSIEKVDEAHVLIKRGHLNKRRATKVFSTNKEKYEEYMKCAESFYNQALSSAKELLRDHELTCTCHKVLGDLYFTRRNYEEAIKHYSDAIQLRRKLKLDSNEPFVYLLKNYGSCLSFLRRFNESMEKLKEARDIVDKLTGQSTHCKANVYCQLAKTSCAWKPDCQEAANYANAAMQMQTFLDSRSLERLDCIIKTAEENSKEENRIRKLNNSQLKSWIPDKPLPFIGRNDEVEQITSSFLEDNCGIVSIVGGPGFGKTTVAVEVSHHLTKNHDIIVIFSFLSNVSTVPEVILRLCLDVGVNPGDDPESSLMFWLRNIEKNVVLVMDNIEQLLEEEVRSKFAELLVTLRKNSQQQLQILTTTRTTFSIPNQIIENVEIGQLDANASVELLEKFCPNKEVKEEILSDLAKLCDFVPLALCIAGSQIADRGDPSGLIQWLRETPEQVLQTSNQSQCILKVIQSSFQKLNPEDKKALARLSVFDGNFQKNSAEEIIERNQDCLQTLVSRGLIQRISDERYVIHSLVRRFLTDNDQLKEEKSIAQGLMVKHFLNTCHLLTISSYSKDGFTDARILLKKDCHNVEQVLKVCSQDQATHLNANIIESLESSDIYKYSSRFFYRFSWDLLQETILNNFLKSCIKLARSRNQQTIEITFQCLAADQEGIKSAWKSTKYINMMEAIKEFLGRIKAVLKEDRSLYMYCYYFHARHYSYKLKDTPFPDLLEDDLASFSENKERGLFKYVDEALILIERANLSKKRASRVNRSDRIFKEYMNCAKSFYDQALSLAKDSLGEHELTFICHKLLGDLYFARWKSSGKALLYYWSAIKLSKKLRLDSNDRFVNLLKNYGLCLSHLQRFDESVETLHEARDTAEKLGEKHTFCKALVYFALARTCRAWKPDCQKAATYANVAMEMQDLLDQSSVEILKEIISTAKAELNM